MHHPIVEFHDVSFTYGEDTVLDRVDVVIREGAFVGVVGPSGAGKSTFLKLASGTLRPTRGTVNIGTNGPVRFGVVPQTEAIDWNFPVTVEEVVLLGLAADGGLVPWASAAQKREARDVLDQLGIGRLARRHIRNLSGGQQQRVFIARALIRRPDLLLLDEPTSGVDVKTRHDVLHLLHTLNHEGIAIVLTTHDLSAVAAHIPSLICLNRRVVASGRPREVLTSANLRELYGAEMVVVQQEGMLLIGDEPSAFQDEHDPADHAEDVRPAHFGEEPEPHDHGPESDHRHPAEQTEGVG